MFLHRKSCLPFSIIINQTTKEKIINFLKIKLLLEIKKKSAQQIIMSY